MAGHLSPIKKSEGNLLVESMVHFMAFQKDSEGILLNLYKDSIRTLQGLSENSTMILSGFCRILNGFCWEFFWVIIRILWGLHTANYKDSQGVL